MKQINFFSYSKFGSWMPTEAAFFRRIILFFISFYGFQYITIKKNWNKTHDYF